MSFAGNHGNVAISRPRPFSVPSGPGFVPPSNKKPSWQFQFTNPITLLQDWCEFNPKLSIKMDSLPIPCQDFIWSDDRLVYVLQRHHKDFGTIVVIDTGREPSVLRRVEVDVDVHESFLPNLDESVSAVSDDSSFAVVDERPPPFAPHIMNTDVVDEKERPSQIDDDRIMAEALQEMEPNETNEAKMHEDDLLLARVLAGDIDEIALQTLPPELRELAQLNKPFTCPICQDDECPKEDVFEVGEPCEHVMCRSCAHRNFQMDLEQRRFPIICPMCRSENSENPTEILQHALQLILTPEELEDYFAKSLNQFVVGTQNVHQCPAPDCVGMGWLDDGEVEFRCPVCNHHCCVKCEVDWHRGKTCQQYQDEKLDTEFDQVVRSNNWMRCPHCKSMVEKTQGCNHMRCRCGREFCYACGGNYPNCNCR